MTHEMTVHVMMAKPHIMAAVAGSQGYASESSARHASPPSATGTTSVVTRIIGTPNKAVTMMVRRGRRGDQGGANGDHHRHADELQHRHVAVGHRDGLARSRANDRGRTPPAGSAPSARRWPS